MEEKRNSNTLSYILLAIIFLAVGYFIGSKLNVSVVENENNNTTNEQTDKQEVTYDTTSLSISGPGETQYCVDLYNVVLTKYNDELYFNVQLAEYQDVNTYIDRFYQAGTSSVAISKINSYKRNENGVKGIKLNISNVSKFITIGSSQTCSNDGGLVILTKDGNVHGISFYSLLIGKTDLTQVVELKDILDIKYIESCQGERCSSGPYAIDKAGNEHSVLNYINIPTKKYNEW